MYRKLRIRISLFSVTFLFLLFLGTIFIVYLTSYQAMMEADREMLSLYAEAYWENGIPQSSAGSAPPGPPPGELVKSSEQPVNEFFSVEMNGNGEELYCFNPLPGKISNEILIQTAKRIIAKEKQDGIEDPWVYHVEQKNGRTLIVMLDNSLVMESSSMLYKHTLQYGGLMVLILIISVWITSGYLVKPLERNEQTQKQFISDAGHELKTPVAVISTNADILERKIGKNRWLDNIRDENERSGELIRQLLELTRTEEEKLPMKKIDLSTLMEKTVLHFEGLAFEKGQNIITQIIPEIRIMGNEGQIASLLSILLDNAIQYNKEKSDINISVSEENNRAMIKISNACEYLSAEKCSMLFQRFYRRDIARNGNGHYGIGLSIARKIVEAHHGNIHAVWKDGEIIFQVSFPLVRK